MKLEDTGHSDFLVKDKGKSRFSGVGQGRLYLEDLRKLGCVWSRVQTISGNNQKGAVDMGYKKGWGSL